MSVSYADLLKQFKLTEVQVEKDASDVFVKVHNKMIGWRNIVPHLFPLDKATQIREDIDQDLHLNDIGKRLALLTRWKQYYGRGATYKKLIQAFLSADKTDLAEFVCQALSEGEL